MMDTPLKSTRRKLKKVLKKTRANLSISTGNIYQKKLKSAINVSLNSTRNVRTLQANNRSLATSLEKMRQDFRQVHDHYTLLLEENHELREKILELKRIDVTEQHIEWEVNKRIQARMENVKKKLGLLGEIATKFLDTLAELSDICLPSKSPTYDDVSSTESSNQNYSLLPNLQILSNDESLVDTSDNEFPQSVVRPEVDMENADFSKNPKRKSQAHDMSLIMEQSMCPLPESISNEVCKLDAVSENSSVSCLAGKQSAATKLPMRVPKQKIQTKKHTTEEMVKNFEKLNTKKSPESSKQMLRRETFVLTTDEVPDFDLLTDIAMPHFLVSDAYAENEQVDLDIQDCSSLPPFSAKIKQSGEKSGNTRKSPKPSYSETSHNSEQSVIKSSPRYRASPSPKRTRQIRKSPRTRSRSRSKPRQKTTKSMSSPIMHQDAEKQKTIKASPVNQKSITQANKKNISVSLTPKKKSPRNVLKHGDVKKQNLFISNEFSLVNIHREKLESTGDYAVINQRCQSFPAAEHTIFPVDDMELTRMEEDVRSLKEVSPMRDSNNRKNTVSEITSHSRSKPRQAGQTLTEAEEFTEEKVPDAVTMRFPKPGQFVFAASRKESDGTRKNLPLVASKTRSKSKKQVSDMIDNLPETVPQSIFDFHDKTPMSLNSEKQVTSVFNISADESSLSPLMSLNRNKSRFHNSNKPTTELSSVSANPESNKRTHPFLNEGFTFEVPLKDASPASKSTYGTRSRSRGRKRYESESDKVEVQARSRGGKRWAQTPAESPVNLKTPSLSTASSDILITNQTSQQSSDQNSRSRSSTGLSSDSKSDKFIVENHDLDSNGLYKQKDFICRKDVQAVARGNTVLVQTRKSSPRSPSITSRRRADKKRGQNKVNQAEKNETSNFMPAFESFVLKTAEKKYMDSLDTDSNNVEENDNRKQRGEMKCLDSSVTCSSESQGTNYFLPGIIMSEITSTGSDEKYDCDQEAAISVQELKSPEMFNVDALSGATLRRKKKPRSRSASGNAREISPHVANTVSDSEAAAFISTRTDKTRGQKGQNKNSGKSETSEGKSTETSEGKSTETSEGKSTEVYKDDLAADGDNIVTTKFTEIRDSCDETDSKSLEDSSQLLEKLRYLKTPALSYSEENVLSGDVTSSNDNHVTPRETEQGPRTSRIVRVPSTGREQSLTKRAASVNSPERLTEGKRRRAATKVNYAEMPLNMKLRRGDPYTSHYCSADKIDIFKSPKSKAKKKVVHRNILSSLHNFSISEEIGHPVEENT